ncbi:MAG: hypothetical protein ACK40M_05700 [Flavobacteriales bacterium]
MRLRILHPHTLLLAITFCSASLAVAGPGNTDGNNDKSTETSTETKTTPVPFNLNSGEWVIIEVIEDNKPQPQPDKVTVERKNISQMTVTKVEVRSCQKNTTPEQLIPILREINQTVNHRRIYMQEENGKKIWYISPEFKEIPQVNTPAPAAAPAELTVPFIFQIKI